MVEPKINHFGRPSNLFCQGMAQDDIVIMNNDSIITEKSEICNLFNECYVNIVAGVGSDTSINTQTMRDKEEKYINHPSIDSISKHVDKKIGMEFGYINQDYVTKLIQEIDVKKSAGWDDLPPKILKLAGNHISLPITHLINQGFKQNKFPSLLKYANVTPIYKKNDRMVISNYQPVSVLPTLSKMFERVIANQLTHYFETYFHPDWQPSGKVTVVKQVY